MTRARIALVLVMLVACGASAALALAQADADRLAAGTSVAGVDVSGLTQQAAVERVWSRLRTRWMRSVTVRVGSRDYKLTAHRAGLRLRLPAAVARAHRRGRPDNVLVRGWRALANEPVNVDEDVQPTVSESAVRSFVAEVARDVERPAVDAELSLAVDRVAVVRERRGRRLAATGSLNDRLLQALREPRADRSLRASVTPTDPGVTVKDLWQRTPVVVTVSRADRRARVFRRGALVASYRVAVGEPEYQTPVGRFAIQTKQKNPVWNVPDSPWAGDLAGKVIPPGDPRNALVARWIGFDGAVGFHGTKSLDSLGRAASRGCVRMSRDDVVALYDQVEAGTPVLVGR